MIGFTKSKTTSNPLCMQALVLFTSPVAACKIKELTFHFF